MPVLRLLLVKHRLDDCKEIFRDMICFLAGGSLVESLNLEFKLFNEYSTLAYRDYIQCLSLFDDCFKFLAHRSLSMQTMFHDKFRFGYMILATFALFSLFCQYTRAEY
jgi:hypothetical protein